MSDERVLYEPGQVIADRYLVEEVVGRGTTGTVYRAENLTPDTIPERVAIKVVHPHLRQERQVLGRLRREARILARVESPYLCPLYEFIEDEHRIILVLEYVDGPALDAYIARRDGPLPLGEALEIGRQVCEALEAAHRAGVIHRDLKPANILVEGVADEEDEQTPPRSSFLRDLRVRVVDFGLAKDIEGDMTSSHTVLTEQDMVFGTPDYMAPEQVAGETIDARSDVYAAGILLYELVAGTRPFDHASPIATMRAHLQEAVLSPRERAGVSVPEALEQILFAALEKNPESRIPSASALGEAIAKVDLAAPSVAADEQPPSSSFGHAETAIHTTMASEEDEHEGEVKQGAKVRIVVRDAPSEPPSRTPATPTTTPPARPPIREHLPWAVATVIVTLVAIGLGIFFGTK